MSQHNRLPRRQRQQSSDMAHPTHTAAALARYTASLPDLVRILSHLNAVLALQVHAAVALAPAEVAALAQLVHLRATDPALYPQLAAHLERSLAAPRAARSLLRAHNLESADALPPDWFRSHDELCLEYAKFRHAYMAAIVPRGSPLYPSAARAAFYVKLLLVVSQLKQLLAGGSRTPDNSNYTQISSLNLLPAAQAELRELRRVYGIDGPELASRWLEELPAYQAASKLVLVEHELQACFIEDFSTPRFRGAMSSSRYADYMGDRIRVALHSYDEMSEI